MTSTLDDHAADLVPIAPTAHRRRTSPESLLAPADRERIDAVAARVRPP